MPWALSEHPYNCVLPTSDMEAPFPPVLKLTTPSRLTVLHEKSDSLKKNYMPWEVSILCVSVWTYRLCLGIHWFSIHWFESPLILASTKEAKIPTFHYSLHLMAECGVPWKFYSSTEQITFAEQCGTLSFHLHKAFIWKAIIFKAVPHVQAAEEITHPIRVYITRKLAAISGTLMAFQQSSQLQVY